MAPPNIPVFSVKVLLVAVATAAWMAPPSLVAVLPVKVLAVMATSPVE
jgi:hypothetical protein